MSPAARRNLALLAGTLLLVALCLIFPRALRFVELASRELRYFWWLILMLALGLWLAFFFGRKRN